MCCLFSLLLRELFWLSLKNKIGFEESCSIKNIHVSVPRRKMEPSGSTWVCVAACSPLAMTLVVSSERVHGT